MSSIAPPQPKYHHYRPLEGDARVRAEPRPCLKCMVCLSPCRCDAEAEERKRMREAREGRTEGMTAIVEEMMKKTKLICGLSDLATVEEALAFLEENRVTVRPEKESK